MRLRSPHPAMAFAVIFAAVFLLHAPLLQLPYFWDEAGYYVPAARDLLLTESLIPHSTVSNAHPPLVLAWIAAWWKLAGYTPLVTRSAMLFISAFALLGVFRLAERVANIQVAIASTLCTALYPVFFAQSSLAQLDLATAGLTCWGLWAYLEERPCAAGIFFSLAALAKETAILAPAALAGWQIFTLAQSKRSIINKLSSDEACEKSLCRTPVQRIISLCIPVFALLAWYAFHYARTGYIFGNPEFFRYNVGATLSFTRFVLALGMRLWQIFAYQCLWTLTLGMLLAMLLSPLKDAGVERPRIASPVLAQFVTVVAAYVVAMSLIGGAVLARYMLPAIPLVIIVAVSTLRRRLRYWPAAIVLCALAFITSWFWNPPYGFSLEDNLAYRDYVWLHEEGGRFLEARYPMARVLTAWPASDELTRPWLGYITRPMKVVRIENFSLDEVLSAADFRSNFEVALVFSTKYEPAHPLIDRWKKWEELKTRYFGFHRDLPPAAVAKVLGGRLVYLQEHKGQWIAVIEMERI